MYNAITYALNELNFSISREMLEIAFITDEERKSFFPVSVESVIRKKIIENKVLVDCNLYHGTTMHVPLSDLPGERKDDFTVIYQIPKSRTGGRPIMAALAVTYGNSFPANATFGNMPGRSALSDAANQVLNSHAQIPLVSTAAVDLVGDNVICVRDTIIVPTQLWLDCRVANDAAMNHLQPANFGDFAQLVDLATKAWIYTNVRIPMDMGRLHGGSDLGRIREELDSFSDARNEYKTFLEEDFAQVSVMNDGFEHERFLRVVVGGGY